MWFDEPNKAYFDMIEKHRDRIIIEIVGHDHFADLRYNTSTTDEQYFYHNMLVVPAVTPVYNSNPGVAYLEIDDDLKPVNFKQSNLNLYATLGKDDDTPYEKLEFRDLDYAAEFGLKDLTPESIAELT